MYAYYFKNVQKTQLLKEWKIKVLRFIDEHINFSKTNNSKFKHSNKDYLKNSSIVTALENLHKNFIVAPIGKANGNIVFICKRFYTKRLLKELGVYIQLIILPRNTQW